MTNKFTASEVRDASHKYAYEGIGDDLIDILHAYADMLAEREETLSVPMNLRVALDFADNPRPYHSLACPADTNGELYRALKVLAAAYRAAHSAQAQPANEVRHPSPEWFDERLHEELMPNKAQAQPPTTRVPDGLVDALRHQRQIDEDGAEVGVSRQAVDEAANILAMLAAVPQPPTTRVPDWTDAQCVAFMAVGLRHTEYKKGKSPTVEEIRQGAKAALAAQENPNG